MKGWNVNEKENIEKNDLLEKIEIENLKKF